MHFNKKPYSVNSIYSHFSISSAKKRVVANLGRFPPICNFKMREMNRLRKIFTLEA